MPFAFGSRGMLYDVLYGIKFTALSVVMILRNLSLLKILAKGSVVSSKLHDPVSSWVPDGPKFLLFPTIQKEQPSHVRNINAVFSISFFWALALLCHHRPSRPYNPGTPALEIAENAGFNSFYFLSLYTY